MGFEFHYKDEKYFCLKCDVEYEESRLRNGRERWKCSSCDDHLSIKVQFGKEKFYLKRLYPIELKREPMPTVDFSTGNDVITYNVVSCNKDNVEEDYYQIIMKGYKKKYHKDRFVNVRNGSW